MSAKPAKGKAPKGKTPTVAKAASPAKSPPRGKAIANRMSIQEIREKKPRIKGWYIDGGLLEGSLGYFTVTQSNPGNDAYSYNIQLAVNDKNSTEAICRLGIVGGFYLRKSLKDDTPLLNQKDEYARRAYIMLMEQDEMTKEGLHAKLLVVKAFLEKPENNKYNTNVYIPSDYDKTPPEPNPLPRLDTLLQYKEIVRFIEETSRDSGPTWYGTSEDTAWCYFTEGYVPFEAVMDLGFPEIKVAKPRKLLNLPGSDEADEE